MYDKQTVYRAAIHYLHFKRSLRKVAKIYGCGYTTLGGWVRQQAGSSTHRSRRARRSPISDAISDTVARCIEENPFTTLSDIVKRISVNDRKASVSTVRRVLRKQKVSRKRVRVRYSPKEPTKQQAQQFLDDIQSQEIISIDETSVVLESVPIYGYSLKGTRVVKRTSKPVRGNRVTLLLAISNTRGVVHHATYSGSCNSEKFAAFIDQLPDFSSSTPMILDNVRFHHSHLVKRAANNKKIHLVFTPPYCPDFNPIETAFSVIKSVTRRFDDSLPDAIQSVTPKKFAAFFYRSIRHVTNLASELPDDS